MTLYRTMFLCLLVLLAHCLHIPSDNVPDTYL